MWMLVNVERSKISNWYFNLAVAYPVSASLCKIDNLGAARFGECIILLPVRRFCCFLVALPLAELPPFPYLPPLS
jgi:hypothetical protein